MMPCGYVYYQPLLYLVGLWYIHIGTGKYIVGICGIYRRGVQELLVSTVMGNSQAPWNREASGEDGLHVFYLYDFTGKYY